MTHVALSTFKSRASGHASAAARVASAAALALTTALSTLPPSFAQEESSHSRNYFKVTAENAQIAKEIKLGLDKSIVIDLPADAHDILVANPDVADAVTRTSRRIYVFGKQIGQTNIFVFDGRGQQIAALELIIERDIAGLEGTIRRLVPNSDVRAEMINDNIVLTGSVDTPQNAAKVVRLAEIFVKGGEATAQQSGGGGGEAPGGTLLLSGTEDTPQSQIVNMLRIEGDDQVHLKVVIAEIQRSVVKQLGLTSNLTNDATDGFGFSLLGASTPFLDHRSVLSGGTLGVSDTLGSLNASYQALERNGVMKTLAEPSLTAISGETAHFRVGGTYNLPQTIGGSGENFSVTYDQVDYGIGLTFTPVVLSPGRISLKIRTEVSEPTVEGTFAFGSTGNLLSVRKRLADTTVELPSGGSMVIAGLIQDDVRQTVNGQPGLMNLPFFGTLFRSREFVRNESEVVVFVTPYLVRPTALASLTQPDKNFQPASDAAGNFMGRINRVYGTKQGDLPEGRYTGAIGFIFK